MAAQGPNSSALVVAPASKGGSFIDREEAARLERLAAALSEQAPPWAARYVQQLAPAFGILGAGVHAAAPAVVAFYGGLYRSYQALPRNAANGLWGLSLCFFGGRYAAAIAAAEAFRTSGGSQMLTCLQDLHADAEAVLRANAEDDTKDEDGDGTSDVTRLSNKQLATRKLALVLRTVDPSRLSAALGGLWAGYMGVIVALKFRFARTVALAHSIGDSLRPIAAKQLAPTALALTPVEYRQWVVPAINLSCKCLAMVVAWKVQQAVSSVQSGIAGGLLASRSLLLALQDAGYVKSGILDTMADEALGWSLAAVGIYFQVVKRAPIPVVVAPIFWPVDILERWLQWSITFLGDK